MAKKKDKPNGYDKLLEFWQPPESAGEPVGCVATSFTFNNAFFEKECLGRFVNLQADPDEDGPVYLIEREEKLRSLACASALVDVSWCGGVRNLYWDLIPIKVSGAIMHAKVSLLYWRGHLRIIAGSANLTEDGYCRNQEVFGVIDYYPDCDASAAVLGETLSFLHKVLDYAVFVGEDSPALRRVRELLDRISRECTGWAKPASALDRNSVRVDAVAVLPGNDSVFKQIASKWPAASPPYSACVVSPFFDDDAETNPAVHIWKQLRQRGKAEVIYVPAGDDRLDADKVFLQAPEVISVQTPGNRSETNTAFCYFDERDVLDHNVPRPLHAKSLSLWDDDWLVYMIGSSNFTAAGYGLRQRCNIEFNLSYFVNRNRNPEDFKRIRNSLLPSKEIGRRKIEFMPSRDADAESALNTVSLPDFFGTAVYECLQDGAPVLRLSFEQVVDAPWKIFFKDGNSLAPVLDSHTWAEKGHPLECLIPWQDQAHIPSGLEIQWGSPALMAWWPVMLRSHQDMRSPDALRELPLELLIDILTSSVPVAQVVARWLKRHPGILNAGTIDMAVVLDPHAKVDTSRFLLKRTAKLSLAFNGLRKKLEMPAATIENLRWRLRGPVGVLALIDAIRKSARSKDEQAFFLTELCFELHRVNPASAEGYVPVEVVRRELGTLISEIVNMIKTIECDDIPVMKTYIADILSEVRA